MSAGTFYAVGVGPGEPELLTLKAVRVLKTCRHIYVPFSEKTTQTWVADAVRRYCREDATVYDVAFSLGRGREERERHWRETASEIVARLRAGDDVAFVTLGDPLLYSTAIYLIRVVRELWSGVVVDIVPGISAYAHCAALTGFPLGEGSEPVTIVPSITALDNLQAVLEKGGTLVLMKVGRQLPALIDLLEANGLLERSVFVARAGLPDQRVETDLRRLRGADPEVGNLAVILIHTEKK